MRQRALLSLSLPLAAAGCLAGHSLGYGLVGADSQDGRVHGYLSHAPQFIAACVALVVLALGLRFAGRLQGRPAVWPLAVLPPVAFCAQELAERLAAGLPAHTVLEPPVFVGLAAQIPVALAAYALARALLSVTDTAVRAFAAAGGPVSVPSRPLPAPTTTSVPTRAPIALDSLGRAPPRR